MRLPFTPVIWALALASAISCPAKFEEWKDPQGNTFKAEPSEAIGPFALFTTPSGGGRRLPWRALAPADCVRFEQQAGSRPGPAATWANATGKLTGRLRGHLRQHVGAGLVNADLGQPEPQLLIVFFVDNSVSQSWDMLGKAIEPYRALQGKFPGQAAGIQFGVNHGPQEHTNMAVHMQVPWTLVAYDEQKRLNALERLSPRRSEFGLMVLSRDGVPVFAAENPDAEAVARFFTDVGGLLELLRPGNPLGWPDRAHYLSATQAARHQGDRAGPVLVGDPLVPQGLRERGIFRVAATIEVGVDGKPTAVSLKDEASLPKGMGPALVKALQRSAVFAPAVDHGQFVAGTYDYLVEVPR